MAKGHALRTTITMGNLKSKCPCEHRPDFYELLEVLSTSSASDFAFLHETVVMTGQEVAFNLA